MKVLIIASRADAASMNIAGHLLASYGLELVEDTRAPPAPRFGPLYARGEVGLLFTDLDCVQVAELPEGLVPEEAVIFASRHASTAGSPALTAHTPGNLGHEARHGGRPRELAWADPARERAALLALEEAGEELGLTDYTVSLEATHHGPTGLAVPVLFVEIGSTPDRWRDELAGEAVARAIWEAARRPAPGPRSVGFGGGHYAPKLTAAALEVGLAIGHIVPKYAFKALGPDRWLVEEPVRRTWGGCEAVVLDKKGLRSQDRKLVVSVAEELGLEVCVI